MVVGFVIRPEKGENAHHCLLFCSVAPLKISFLSLFFETANKPEKENYIDCFYHHNIKRDLSLFHGLLDGHFFLRFFQPKTYLFDWFFSQEKNWVMFGHLFTERNRKDKLILL